MADLQWPDSLRPSSCDLTLESNAQVFSSPFSKAEQVVSFPGDRWRMTISFNRLSGDDRMQFEALVSGLRGMTGRIRLWDFAARYLHLGKVSDKGSPTVSGAGQQGLTLVTAGWTPGAAVLKVGDWIEVNGELKRVVKPCTASGLGYATIEFVPPLRNSPPAATPIEYKRPCGLFRLADNNQAKFGRKSGREIQIAPTLDFVETWIR